MPGPTGTIENQIKLYTRSRRLSWEVDHLPPKLRIYLFINGTPYSQYVQPAAGDLGDPVFTDEFGHAEGSLVIPRNAEEKFLVGEIRITFADHPTDLTQSNFITESTFYSQPNNEAYNVDQGGVQSTRLPIPIRKVPGSNIKETDVLANSTSLASNKLQPLAQTFFVDPAVNPLGVYVMSTDLFFLEKDDSLPISIELRRTSNGIPVNDSYISGSSVRLYPNQIAVPAGITTGENGSITVQGSTTVVGNQGNTLAEQINAYIASVVFTSGSVVETYEQTFIGGSTLDVRNIYSNLTRFPSTLFLTLLPGYSNYVVERRTPIEIYNLSVTGETSGLPPEQRTYIDPRTNTKYNAGITIGVNFMVRNGTLYTFPDAPSNTVTYTIQGGTSPINVTLTLTDFGQEILNGATVTPTPDAASTPLDAAGSLPATNFEFDHPIYLSPGLYALCVKTNSDKYTLITSSADRNLLPNSGPRKPEVLAGQMFRSGNAGDRIANNNTDLCFVLYKCKFDTGVRSLFVENQAPDTAFIYDAAKIRYTYLRFPGIATITPKVRTTEESGVASDFVDINENKTNAFDTRRKVQAQGDQTIEMIFQTNSQDVSPMLDKEKLLGILYKYDVSPYETDLSDAELLNEANPNRSRYISKMVTLLPGFESNGMEVRVDVNRKIGTDIEVFVKVLSPNDPEPPAKRSWKRMNLVSNNGIKSYVGFSETEFVTEYYQLLSPDLEYEDIINLGDNNTPARFNDFNRYMIKVVFYSSNTRVPKIKDLFASACIDTPSTILSNLGTSALLGSSVTNKTSLRLPDLVDVSDQAPSNGQVLSYNDTSGLWEATTPATGGGTLSINDLSDVITDGVNSQGQPLTAGQVLGFDGSAWKPATISVPSGGATSGYLELVNQVFVPEGELITPAIGTLVDGVYSYVLEYDIIANSTQTTAFYGSSFSGSNAREEYLSFQVSEDGQDWWGVGDSYPYLPWFTGNQRGGAFGSTEICFGPHSVYVSPGLPYSPMTNYQKILYSGRMTLLNFMDATKQASLVMNYGYQTYPSARLGQGVVISTDAEGATTYGTSYVPGMGIVREPVIQLQPPSTATNVNKVGSKYPYIRFLWNSKQVSGSGGFQEPYVRFREGTNFRLYKVVPAPPTAVPAGVS